MVPPDGVKGGIRRGRPRLRGEATIKPRLLHSPSPDTLKPSSPGSRKGKKRVLFVCIGNACRSQMAEAFARAYGSDVLSAHSAGLAPAGAVPPLTRQVLNERNIPVEGQYPKGYRGATTRYLLAIGAPTDSTFRKPRH